ncbi:toxin glutamine deamidase domain-containing protein [Micromonospora sp. B11E3]|uniref:toxin glutamine deamidase domain-containing protein n=1 Tax=Micromonospora sp. B11E3 TaxID=3153562 RepID=UPI00325F82D8
MSLLPSPIPHPLDYSPWELPGWVYEALDWVVGVEWPEGNERAVWDLADQWYDVAAALAGPRDDAIAAVGEVRGGFGGVGAVAEAFDAAWRRVAEGDEAPLPVLLAVSTDLGRLVEECGCDIEGAKLEVWIELGILVVELLALAVAAVLTAGAASPAAGAAIAATRVVVQQIFKRLMAQLARKSLRRGLKEAGERAAKQVAERGMRGLARKAALGGLEEAAQESGVTLATQAYQNSTGRRHGLDVTDIGMSALGGAAGGAAAPLAGLGRHATGRAARMGEHFGREMSGEVIAEQAAGLATGQGLVSLEDAARAAASGATGSATGQADVALHARLDARMAALAGAPLAPPDLPVPPDLAVPPDAAVAPAPSAQERVDTAYAGLDASGSGSPPGRDDGRTPTDAVHAGAGGADQGLGSSQAADGKPSLDHAGGGPQPLSGPTVGDGAAASSAPVDARLFESSPVLSAVDIQAAPAVTEAPRSALSSLAAGDVAQLAGRGADAGTGAVVGGTGPLAGANASVAGSVGTGTSGVGPVAGGVEAGAGGPSAGTASSGARTVHASAASPLASVPSTAASAPISPLSTSGSAGQPVPGPRGEPVPPRFPKLEALNPNPRPATPQPSAESADSAVPLPRSPEWWAAKWAADREAFDRRRYRDYFERQRAWFEDKRRRHLATELRKEAEYYYKQARWLIGQAHSLAKAGRTRAADEFVLGGRERERESYRQTDLADAVLEGRVAPPVVKIDNWDDFSRINTDDPSLVVATVEPGGPSALTGDDDPPPIDRSRRYGEWGGLRPPLALHQSDLERAMPRDAAGRILRTADPRRGGWFRLANDGGPSADATRAINCLDCTLSLYETWVHGRPRVSAPRTFDSYAEGDITRPLGGEIGGPGRVEAVTGGRFQQLAKYAPARSPGDTCKAVNRGFGTIEAQLRAGGHGSYAFLVTAYEGGGSHAWVALNQNGSVLYLDPQSGSVSDMPLYTHNGWTARHNVTDIDALCLGPDGRPMPVPGAPPGQFSQFEDFVEPEPAPEDRGREWQPGPDDPSDEELYVNRVYLLGEPTLAPSLAEPAGLPEDSLYPSESGPVVDAQTQLAPHERQVLTDVYDKAQREADAVQARLQLIGRRVTAALSLDRPIQLRDVEFRIKSLESLSRKFLDEAGFVGMPVEEFAGVVNDVLRFSFAMPGPGSYRQALEWILNELALSGFDVPDSSCKNFWRSGNRFYGFNCTVRSPSGQLFELQMHTDASREAWRRTHAVYEILRLRAESAQRRVTAYLKMLSVNRECGMPEAVPEGLSLRFPAKDSTFAKWIAENRDLWREYLDWLEREGKTFSAVTSSLGLTSRDFPISDQLEIRLEKESVDILRGLSERGQE